MRAKGPDVDERVFRISLTQRSLVAYATGLSMHQKRKRPTSTRSGCLLCKPHKRQGACDHATNMKCGNRRRYEVGTDQIRCEKIETRAA